MGRNENLLACFPRNRCVFAVKKAYRNASNKISAGCRAVRPVPS
jgi:hypothetical protein